ncbi:IS66 family transposase zinc-finger binding domain-containing protein, partial [Bradyrhizobium sp. 147]|uniref:IS66 family transposase n=1 Tax=Bradyrhizobium sp. 147 TaxID=2782623 RepID=UPI001FF83A40
MLKAMLLAERCESERLRQIIKELQRHRFGRRAETLPEDQMLLGLEDVEQVAAYSETAQDVSAPEGREVRARKRRGNRGALPVHLPRIEVVVDIEDKTCPCCQRELHRVGEDRSERLDLVPAQFRILVTRRGWARTRAFSLVGVRFVHDESHIQDRREPRPGQ